MIGFEPNNAGVNSLRYLLSNAAAVLFASYDLSNKLDAAQSLNRKTKHILDSDPVLLPIPDDAPAEIPRIILASKDQRYRCNVATGRLEFAFVEGGEPQKKMEDVREQFLTVLRTIASVLKEEWKARVFRLGFVTGLLAFHSDPVGLLKGEYIREGALGSPQQLEVHTLSRLTLDDVEVNRWCRLSTIAIPTQKGERKALSVIFDINTITDKKHDFGVDSLTAFYDRATTHVSQSLETLISVPD